MPLCSSSSWVGQRRVGHGYRRFTNYRLRLFLHCGTDWHTPTATPIRGRLPRLAALSQFGSPGEVGAGGVNPVARLRISISIPCTPVLPAQPHQLGPLVAGQPWLLAATDVGLVHPISRHA